jgi:hypothetical protein
MKTKKEPAKKLAGNAEPEAEKPKSRLELFWERNPGGIISIVNRKAALG